MEHKLALALAVALLSLFGSVRSGFLDGDCELKYPNGKEVEYIEWLYDLFLYPAVLDTTPPGTEIARFSTRNIDKITSRQSKYLKTELTNSSLILTLHEDFIYFEEWETEPDIKLNLDFQCKDGTARIAMWALVEDTNNHAPAFGGAPPYVYTLPLPFPPAVPLACVTGVVASAVDFDLSTTRILFHIEGTDALEVTGAWKVGRVFHANITTTRYITAPLNATLRATDNGEPPQSSQTTLQVVADAARSLPAPVAAAAAAAAQWSRFQTKRS